MILNVDKMVPRHQEFARNFFGVGNWITWKQIQEGSYPPNFRKELEFWLLSLQYQQLDRVILPRVAAEGGTTSWYIMTRDQLDVRALSESIEAFVGPTYAHFTGMPAQLDNSDPVERAVADLFGNNVFKLETPHKFKTSVRLRLREMLTLWRERPRRRLELTRATGRIILDFEYELRQRNEERLEELINELESKNRLTPRNILFLRVLKLEALEHWSELLELTDLRTLLEL